MDISSIITNTKKGFTRERTSVILDFLKSHDDCVIISYINKDRGKSIKFYYLKDGKKVTSDYILKNAKVIITALLNNGKKIYLHNSGTIEEYNEGRDAK